MLDKEILVVDDEKNLRIMIRSIFESAGCAQVRAAASGEEALALIAKKIPGITFLPKELFLRVQAILKRAYPEKNRIVTIGVLCQTLCGDIWQGYETTLMTHIRHLREKIEENPSKPVSLLTVKGLGVLLVRQIVEAHKGTIVMESAPRKGFKTVLAFPV